MRPGSNFEGTRVSGRRLFFAVEHNTGGQSELWTNRSALLCAPGPLVLADAACGFHLTAETGISASSLLPTKK
jgi:hypothetical protein